MAGRPGDGRAPLTPDGERAGSYLQFFLPHSTRVPEELLEDELEDELLLDDEEEPLPEEEVEVVPLDEEVVPEELVVVPLEEVSPLEEVVPLEEVSPLEEVVPLEDAEEVVPLEVDVSPLEELVLVPDELPALPLEELPPVLPEELEELVEPAATASCERWLAVVSNAASSAPPSCVRPTMAATPTAAASRAYSTDVTPASSAGNFNLNIATQTVN
jgi:hypothetical protein